MYSIWRIFHMNALFFLTDAAAGGGMTWVTMGLLLVVMVAMFWFTSRSNKKQEKQAQNMRDSLSVGDEITTIGGIITTFMIYLNLIQGYNLSITAHNAP